MLREFEKINPPIIRELNWRNRTLFFGCDSLDQVSLAYDVYIVGQLAYYGYEHDKVQNSTVEVKQLIEVQVPPFKIVVGEPYNLIFNTAPSIEFLPSTLELKAGEKLKIPFGEANDFEGNRVVLQSASLRSYDASSSGGNEANEYLQVYNSTALREVTVGVGVPSNFAFESLKLTLTFLDDH